MVHVHSPKLQKAILFSWAAFGLLIGAVVLNPENWVQRNFCMIGIRNRPSPKYYEHADTLGRVVGGVCGLLFFGLGATYVVHSRWHLRWVIGGSIAFFAAIPATMVHREIFPTVDDSQVFVLYYSSKHLDINSLIRTVWTIPGLVWGISWWFLENVVLYSANRRTRARFGSIDKTSQRLPVVSRRLT